MRSIKRMWVLRKNECSRIPSIFSNGPAMVKSNILMLFSYPSYLKTSPEKRYQETQPFCLSVRTAEGSYFFFHLKPNCVLNLPLSERAYISQKLSVPLLSLESSFHSSRHFFSAHVAYFATASNLLSQETKEIFHIKREKNVLEVKFSD